MEAPRFWRNEEEYYKLVGEKCKDCHTTIFPQRDLCPCCGGSSTEKFQLSGKGEIYSIASVNPEHAPVGYNENGPYTVALIKLEEGPLITAQLTDLGNKLPEIGDRVEAVTRILKNDGDERGIVVYGYKFRYNEFTQ